MEFAKGDRIPPRLDRKMRSALAKLGINGEAAPNRQNYTNQYKLLILNRQVARLSNNPSGPRGVRCATYASMPLVPSRIVDLHPDVAIMASSG